MPRIISDAALLSAFSPAGAYASAAFAVSGGPDSMALMHLASRWATLTRRTPASMTVLTVDHGLRAESKDEAAFVAQEAARLGLTHLTLVWAGAKPKAGLQAAARRARYELMTAYCRARGIACLVTAHTQDDQAETFLMRLRRGSGLDGLAAMAPVSERGGMPLVRPLLGLSKARILAYLRERGIPFVSDPSNSSTAFERVRLRHTMKALAAAGITRSALALSASRLGRSREALSRTAGEFLARNFSVTSLGQGEAGLEAFRALPSDIALRVLAHVLALTGGKEEPPRMVKIERLLEELRLGKREASLGGCLAIATPAALHFYREPGRMRREPLLCEPGRTCIWDGRFVLDFAAGASGEAAVAPLGEGGWAHWRKELQKRRLPVKANRLAAVTTPALWQGQSLLAAPALGYINEAIAKPGAAQATLKLVPRLGRFLKGT